MTPCPEDTKRFLEQAQQAGRAEYILRQEIARVTAEKEAYERETYIRGAKDAVREIDDNSDIALIGACPGWDCSCPAGTPPNCRECYLTRIDAGEWPPHG